MILGIDLGAKTTGLAISGSSIATPYKTIIHKTLDQALTSIIRIIEVEKIDTVVIGFVEGKIKTMFTDFASSIKKERPDIEVVLWDETLTSGQARETMIKLELPKFKRRQKEHEYAAAIILQSYLDETRLSSS
ncbi:MAG: Holliday junction resolvase RuvX [Candidatus Curtissbacteria bacterium]|nr:Holliday junction resolvase RuvX [Candidatus Curtissbacteria bacterium]